MAGNRYHDGKNVFIMKCQVGNNSDGQDTRGLILYRLKNPTISAPSRHSSSHQQRPRSTQHVEHVWPQQWLLVQLPARLLPELRFCCKVPLQVSTFLWSMFKSSLSAQPAGLQAAAGPDDAPIGKATLPKTPPAAVHSRCCNQSPKVG